MEEQQALAKGFLEFYYKSQADDKAQLATLYKAESTLSFEGENFSGVEEIGAKLGALPIPAGHVPNMVKIDVQPSPSEGGLVVFTCGDYMEQKFRQVFQLLPTGAEPAFYVHNSIFRVGEGNAMNGPEEYFEFIKHWYACMEGDRAALGDLLADASMMTFEDSMLVGKADTLEKLNSLPALKHDIKTVDIQPVSGSDVLLVVVGGELAILENPPMAFAQVFQLVTNGSGGYYVHNNFFRLNIG
eukprot:TRINITY_DN774084_c0_g1_i1.p1 TRINITY_DN774084_c0_g1~~TRINITY_DN774084_c0_g1_i1.p1  ORF type:complete len:253 (-),score=69.46 TRINITY_DN774084_c0_g1_i1:900-1628(-)